MLRFIVGLRLAHKFFLIAAIAVAMTAYPAFQVFTASHQGWRTAQREAQGIGPAAEILQLIRLTQQHRGLSGGYLGGNEAVKAAREARRTEVGQAMARATASVADLEDARANKDAEGLQAEWTSLAAAVDARQIDGPQSFARHTALIDKQLGLLEDVTDASGMSLDPQADTFYLIQAVLVNLPRLTESLGQARAQGALLLSRGDATPAQRARLATLTDLSRNHMRHARRDMENVRASGQPYVDGLEGPVTTAWTAAEAAFKLVDEQVVQAETLNQDSQTYFNAMTAHIDAQFALIDPAFKALSGELQAREAGERQSMLWLVVEVLVLSVAGGWIMWLVARSTTSAIAKAVKVAQTVAAGDLTSAIEVRSQEETGQLLAALKDMNHSLATVVAEVRLGSDHIATGSSQIATGNADLSQRTEEQASNLQQTAASMEQLTSTVQANAETARQASEIVRGATDAAREGGETVGQVVTTMEAINQSSRKIHDIIGVIDGIAFQTNILALNAAVEAARAGEQGRGFAVVAAEVRNLAQRSAEAAKEIKQLIGESVDRVETGTALVADAGASVHRIVDQVARVNQLIETIAAASTEQSQGIAQVGSAVAQLDQVTQQNAALVEESAAAADSLQNQARRMAALVGRFRLSTAV